MIVTKHKRIAAGGTIALWAKTLALKQLVLVVGAAGTSWVIRIQDKAGTPAIIVPPVTVTAPSTLSFVYQFFDVALPMDGGLDFVTVSGTAGVMDVWFSMEQPSTS